MDKKIEELSKRSIQILEKTKKSMQQYTEERKKLFNYLVEKNDIESWEAYIAELENRLGI